jgi:hypothetical protein
MNEKDKLESGQTVRVTQFSGKELLRTVIEDRGEWVAVCYPPEFAAAQHEGRRADGIAFPREDVRVDL